MTTTRTRRWTAMLTVVAGASLAGGAALAATAAPEAVAGSASRAATATQTAPAADSRLSGTMPDGQEERPEVTDRLVIPSLGDQGYKVITFGADLPAGEYRINGSVTVLAVPTSGTRFSVRDKIDGRIRTNDDRATSFDTSEYFFSTGDQVRVYARNGATLSKIADLVNDN